MTSVSSPPPQVRQGQNRTRIVVAVVVLGIVLAIARLLWRGYFYEVTDNAYVEGHITLVAPRIDGVVMAVHVRDNQVVAAGDRLVDLDPADYSVRIDRILKMS